MIFSPEGVVEDSSPDVAELLSSVFDEDDVCKYFEILKPDCFTIGEESAIDYYNEIVAAQNSKTLVHIIKRRKDYSTTKIINKIKEENYRE